jgi:hypothetical protein
VVASAQVEAPLLPLLACEPDTQKFAISLGYVDETLNDHPLGLRMTVGYRHQGLDKAQLFVPEREFTKEQIELVYIYGWDLAEIDGLMKRL